VGLRAHVRGIASRQMSQMRSKVAQLFGLPPDSPHLQEALTHPSYANEQGSKQHNQRLEFLGDAVLGLCVTELLYKRFPEADEGMLTRTRAQLVNTNALADWAREHGMAELLLLGRGAEAGDLRKSNNVLADLVEAMIAASYLDGGLVNARQACEQMVEWRMGALSSIGAELDPKTELQQRVQALGAGAPTYELVASGGPPHDRWFRVRVRVGDRVGGEGLGRSKRRAESEAARITLEDAEWQRSFEASAVPRSAREEEPPRNES
jgi:ribonuclease III